MRWIEREVGGSKKVLFRQGDHNCRTHSCRLDIDLESRVKACLISFVIPRGVEGDHKQVALCHRHVMECQSISGRGGLRSI